MLSGNVYMEYYNYSAVQCVWARGNDSDTGDLCSQYNWKLMVYIPLSMLALVTNLLALAGFSRPKRKTALRRNLVFLTCSESVLHTFMLAQYFNILAGVCRYEVEDRVQQLVLHSIFFVITDIFIMARNYCNSFITMQRCEAVLFPLKQKRYCCPKNCSIAYSLVLLVALSFSSMRLFDSKLIVCEGSMKFYAKQEDFLYKFQWYQMVESFGFYCIQTAFPVLSVLAASTAIAIRLLKRRTSTELRATDHAKQSKIRATRTVLALAMVFSILETPPMVFTVYLNAVPGDSVPQNVPEKMHVTTEICLVLDSIFNFLVFNMIPGFRQDVVDNLLCRTVRHTSPRKSQFGTTCYRYSESLIVRQNGSNRLALNELHDMDRLNIDHDHK